MNTEEIKILIEYVVSNRIIGAHSKWRLGILEGTLVIVGFGSQTVLNPEFSVMTEYQCQTGFTDSQWALLAVKIDGYARRAEKCLNDLKR